MYQNVDFDKIYSPSKIKLFAQCPQQFYFYYQDPYLSKKKNELKKLPKNIWSFQILGRAVHDAITLFYHLDPKEKTKKKLNILLEETWRSEVMKQKKPPLGKWGGFANLQEERTCYRQGLKMLENFFHIADHNPNIEYLPTKDPNNSINDYIDLITPINGQLNISGKFDLITKENGGLHIIDFKTGKNDQADIFQLRFYKLLAEIKLDQPVTKTSFFFLRTKSQDHLDIKEDKNKIKQEIVEKIDSIESCQNFLPQPSKLCRYCLFVTFCPQKEAVEKIIGTQKRQKNYTDNLPF